MFSVEIIIPLSLQPLKRGDLYDLPLCDVFDIFGDGKVVGGGSRVKNGQVVECVVEFLVGDLDRVLPMVIDVVNRADSPTGTLIRQVYPDAKVLYVV